MPRQQYQPDMAKVPVNGKVLRWAREIRGLELNAAAEMLEVSATILLLSRRWKSTSLWPTKVREE
jgi:hypothetical protein